MSPPAAIIKGMELTEGEWEVITEASTYIIDVDAMAVWRLEGGAGSLDGGAIPRLTLRRDGDRIALVHRPTPVVGLPCTFVLRIRTDGVATLRHTSWVGHIARLR